MLHWTWFVMAAAMVGTLLNIFQRRACFVVWLITNCIWARHNFLIGEPAQGTQFMVYAGLAVMGWIQWGRKHHQPPMSTDGRRWRGSGKGQ